MGKTVDNSAPASLVLNVVDSNGKVWGSIVASGKQFSTGSTGFYGNAKLHNPDNPAAKYQAGITLTLIGSKG